MHACIIFSINKLFSREVHTAKQSGREGNRMTRSEMDGLITVVMGAPLRDLKDETKVIAGYLCDHSEST